MKCEIKTLRRGENYQRCDTYVDYKNTLEKCVKSAQDFISSLSEKDIIEVLVKISSFGKTIYNWKYKPTIR